MVLCAPLERFVNRVMALMDASAATVTKRFFQEEIGRAKVRKELLFQEILSRIE